MINVVAFTGGFVSIGLELTASRLIAPYFGSSTFIWANLIGVTLAFLAPVSYTHLTLPTKRIV